MFFTGMSIFLGYTVGFALVGLISFYLIAKIINVVKINPPVKSLVLFPFAVAFILLVMLLAADIMYGSHNDLKPYFLVAITGFPTGWLAGLIIYLASKKLKKERP